MRELTDRELDAVCGGCAQLFQPSKISTIHQSNSSALVQAGGGILSGNVRGCYTGERRNQHELQLVWYRTLLRSGGGVCFSWLGCSA